MVVLVVLVVVVVIVVLLGYSGVCVGDEALPCFLGNWHQICVAVQ